MALSTLKCNHLMPLCFKGLMCYFAWGVLLLSDGLCDHVADCQLFMAGWQVGQEMSEDISVLSPDNWRSDQGWVCWAVTATVPAGRTDCIAGQLWDSRDCCLRVHVSGACSSRCYLTFTSYVYRVAQNTISHHTIPTISPQPVVSF